MICQHCNKNKSNRPRGLCWSCYYKPGVRDQYPPGSHNPKTSKFAGRPAHQETMDELEKMIAERYPTMPGWQAGDDD